MSKVYPRWRLLPDHGTLLISTDLHGEYRDFERLREIFFELLATDPDTHWAILGDMVHGPDDSKQAFLPDSLSYLDESLTIVEGILQLQAAYPQQIHFVLGNHDYGHVGGPHTSKYYPDEVEALEAKIGEAGCIALRRLFEPALLAIVAPCGAFLTHGSPDDSLRDLDDLNLIQFPPAPEDAYSRQLLDAFLNHYGQESQVTGRLLETVSRKGVPLVMVIHGHDFDPAGYFVEGGNQLCVVTCGAPLAHRRYVVLDLAKRYRNISDLHDGAEIRRLYPHL